MNLNITFQYLNDKNQILAVNDDYDNDSDDYDNDGDDYDNDGGSNVSSDGCGNHYNLDEI